MLDFFWRPASLGLQWAVLAVMLMVLQPISGTPLKNMTLLEELKNMTLLEEQQWAAEGEAKREMELLYYREKANAAIQHSVLTRTEMFPGWGGCRYLNASLKPKAPRKGTSKRNLLVVDAIGGSLARLYNVEAAQYRTTL